MVRKSQQKIFHKPTTREIFNCLSEARHWAAHLITEYPLKPYISFLHWLLENEFFKNSDRGFSVKELAANFDILPTKATKWLFSIYEDLYLLNEEKPDLFCDNSIRVILQMKHYYNFASFTLSLPAIPREFERVTFHFIKAKVGTDMFWVKDIEHVISYNSTTISINLVGGILNKFREHALDQAIFLGWLHWRDVYEKYSFQIDEELKQFYLK